MNLQMTDAEYRLFRDLIRRECGLYFAENRKSFLSSRIEKRVNARSLRSFYGYYRYLQDKDVEQRNELLKLLDILTVNETAFFRNRPQFRLLEQVVLPEILEARASFPRRPLRIWSAGCATGQEPYSIAISVLEAMPHPRPCEFRIIASDLSLTALERADRGIYTAGQVEAIEPSLRSRYLETCPEGYRVREEVKRTVIYDFHNLKHENGLRHMDIVFCRNVLIYFDPVEQRTVVDRFIRALDPGGYLFLGHAESLHGVTNEVQFVHSDGGTAYRRVVT